MKITITNDSDGCPKIETIDDTGTVVNSLELMHSEQVTIEIGGAVSTGPVTPA